MTQDLEVSAARRPPGKGWWIDGRCGLVIFATLFGTILFNLAFSLRSDAAYDEYPLFVTLVAYFRIASYLWLGLLLAPIARVLRRASWYLSIILLLDVLLLTYAFMPPGAGALGEPSFASTGLRVSAALAACLLGAALVSSLSATFRAGVETTRLYGWIR